MLRSDMVVQIAICTEMFMTQTWTHFELYLT